MAKREKEKTRIKVLLADPNSTPAEELAKTEDGPKLSPLVKSILNVLNGPNDSIERLAFEQDPSANNSYQSVYKAKNKLIPDQYLKRIAIQDDLVAAILNARANQLFSFGRERKDRFSTGFTLALHPEVEDSLNDEEKKKVQEGIKRVSKLLLTCGHSKGWSDQEQMSFAQYLYVITRNGLTVGRIATEVIHVQDAVTGKRKFHSFRPIDAGTIYTAVPQKEAAEQVRQEARFIIEQLKNKKLEPERFDNDEYAWVQVIEGRPLQAFTPEECLVHYLYPVADVELEGYPITPLDTAISAVTTHINISTHNKLYFQNGRAARGMLVVKSDDMDDSIANQFRQHFQANINNVNNSHRMPVFGIGKDDEISWQPIETSGRDMEFQYLSDNNARVILSAFQMSPEELPGYAHLSRGTNNQALSESNAEYKLEAHRDLGIRPLIASIEDFLNTKILPLIDPDLAKIVSIKLAGLDSDTPEKESVRLQQDAPIHMTYDEILQKVNKKPVGPDWAGGFPLNQQYQAILDKYFTVGEIMEHFFQKKGASKDPKFQYFRDPFYFQFLQLQMQQQQMQAQAQAQQQQAQAQAQQPQEEEGKEDETPVGKAAGDAQEALGKAEHRQPPSRKRIRKQQTSLVEHVMDKFAAESEKTIDEIIHITKNNL